MCCVRERHCAREGQVAVQTAAQVLRQTCHARADRVVVRRVREQHSVLAVRAHAVRVAVPMDAPAPRQTCRGRADRVAVPMDAPAPRRMCRGRAGRVVVRRVREQRSVLAARVRGVRAAALPTDVPALRRTCRGRVPSRRLSPPAEDYRLAGHAHSRRADAAEEWFASAARLFCFGEQRRFPWRWCGGTNLGAVRPRAPRRRREYARCQRERAAEPRKPAAAGRQPPR
jgi:hypothetical protein